MTEDVSGRAVLKSSAAATVAAVGLSGCTDGSEGVDGETSLVAANWEAAETPTEETLYDVAYTSDGPYVVGTAGLVLGRTGEGWEKVLDGGPTGNGNDLYGADVTDDGDRLWFVGASGAIGEYDVTAGSLNDYSAPDDVTNNFNDVAVTAAAGEANTFVAGDSGKIYVNFDNGASGKWDSTTPRERGGRPGYRFSRRPLGPRRRRQPDRLPDGRRLHLRILRHPGRQRRLLRRRLRRRRRRDRRRRRVRPELGR